MIDFATTLAFVAGLVFGYLNLRAVTGPDMPAAHRPGRRESHGCEPVHRALLDDRRDPVLASAQAVNQSFSLSVARHGDGEVGISREPRLSAREHRKTTDRCKGHMDFSEICVDVAYSRFERCHANLVRTSTDRPEQSPDSAPGLSSNHS